MIGPFPTGSIPRFRAPSSTQSLPCKPIMALRALIHGSLLFWFKRLSCIVVSLGNPSSSGGLPPLLSSLLFLLAQVVLYRVPPLPSSVVNGALCPFHPISLAPSASYSRLTGEGIGLHQSPWSYRRTEYLNCKLLSLQVRILVSVFLTYDHQILKPLIYNT